MQLWSLPEQWPGELCVSWLCSSITGAKNGNRTIMNAAAAMLSNMKNLKLAVHYPMTRYNTSAN